MRPNPVSLRRKLGGALQPDATDYTAQLQALLPPGPLWDALRQPGTTAAELVAALAEELARLDARTEDLLAELDPRSAL